MAVLEKHFIIICNCYNNVHYINSLHSRGQPRNINMDVDSLNLCIKCWQSFSNTCLANVPCFPCPSCGPAMATFFFNISITMSQSQ